MGGTRPSMTPPSPVPTRPRFWTPSITNFWLRHWHCLHSRWSNIHAVLVSARPSVAICSFCEPKQLGSEGGASSSQLQLSGTHCRFTFTPRPSAAVSFEQFSRLETFQAGLSLTFPLRTTEEIESELNWASKCECDKRLRQLISYYAMWPMYAYWCHVLYLRPRQPVLHWLCPWLNGRNYAIINNIQYTVANIHSSSMVVLCYSLLFFGREDIWWCFVCFYLWWHNSWPKFVHCMHWLKRVFKMQQFGS